MKYSEKRLRQVLAALRVLVGLIYIYSGYEKLFDAMFFENGFMQRLLVWEVNVAPWYSWMGHILSEHTHRWAAFFGTVELFIGVALLLGLATRPACLVGIVYILHRFALSWYPAEQPFMLWQFLDLHLEQTALLGLFLLLGVGHAGDVWGLGAFYHRTRLRLRAHRPKAKQYSYFDSPEEAPEEPKAESDEPEVMKNVD